MNLASIIQEHARFTQRSDVEVKTDAAFSWVELRDTQTNESLLFLQGHEADYFIDRAREIWEETRTLPMDICELAVAYEYLDALEG